MRKLLTFALLMTCMSVYADTTKFPCKVITSKNVTTLPLDEILKITQMFLYEQSGVPGLMLGIIEDQQQAIISCGETAKGSGKQPDGQTIWPIGSVSKVITTNILAQMVRSNDINLATPIQFYLPKEVNVPAYKGYPITLLTLATQSASLPRQLPIMPDNNNFQINYPYNAEKLYPWLSNYQLKFKPGTHYEYSNVGFGILGNLLAHKKGISYGELLNQMITKPLNMIDTTVSLTPEQKAREVKTYWFNGDLIKEDWVFDFENPSGGIYSTTNDLLKFIQYELGLSHQPESGLNNQLSHASYIYQTDFDNPLSFNADAMALGWNVIFPSQGLPIILTKSGWVDGANCYIDLVPNKNIGIVSFTNKPFTDIDSGLRKLIAMIIQANTK